MELILFTIYFIILAVLLLKLALIRESRLKSNVVLALFALKIAAGLAYGYIHTPAFGADTWAYFIYGRLVFELLPEAPLQYLQLVFLSLPEVGSPGLEEISERIHSWKSPSSYFLIRVQALIHLFSFGYYSVHVLVWEFLSLIGIVALFRFVTEQIPKKTNGLFLILLFLPGMLFWLSGLHKEGFCIFLIGMICWNFYLLLSKKGSWWSALLLVLALFLLAQVRLYLFALLFPALICYGVFFYHKQKLFLKFLGLYSGLLLIVFTSLHFLGINVWEFFIVTQRNYVLHYHGQSDFPMEILEPNALSFLKAVPEALMNVLLRPFPQDISSWKICGGFLDTWISLCSFAILLFGFSKSQLAKSPTAYFCLFFALPLVVLIGWLIDNTGAIVRYRVIAYFFLFAFFWGTNVRENYFGREFIESLLLKKREGGEQNTKAGKAFSNK